MPVSIAQPTLEVVSNKIKIEKGIPVRGSVHQSWPFREMEVGDSFLIPADKRPTSARTAAENYSTREGRGRKFKTLKTPDGYRCWRIA